MNNTFNIKRFGFVFRKELMENGKRYMLLFLTMLGLLTIAFTILSLSHYDTENTVYDYVGLNHRLLVVSLIMFGIGGILFASMFMNPMNSKTKRISYLVSPSSNFEKYLSRWFIITIGYIIVFFVALWIADTIRVGICSASFPDLEIKCLDVSKLVYTGSGWRFDEFIFPKDIFILSVGLYFLFQSIFLLGATFWEKNSFIKTFTAGAVIVLSFIWLCRLAILFFYSDFNEFGNVLESFEPGEKTVIRKAQAVAIISSGLSVVSSVLSVFTLFNWIIAYFRLCESEITKRL